MNTISFLNAMKEVFSTLGAKTSDSNYGVALLDKTSGEPKGLMGMSDLASVLGGAITRFVDANTILSNITDDANVCWGRGVDTPSDAPFYAAGVCMVKKTQYGCIQVAFKSAGEFDGFYINQRWMTTWSGWKKSIVTNV